MGIEELIRQYRAEIIEWSKRHAALIAESGKPLNPLALAVARAVGVRNPERIRICVVDGIPSSDNVALNDLAASLGVVKANTAGLTLGYGIYLLSQDVSVQLLSHECRHVHQYESLGSLEAFLAEYLGQIARHGYFRAPLEIDARTHELSAWPPEEAKPNARPQ